MVPLLQRLVGEGRREVWPRWAARVGGSWKKSGVWSHDAVVVDVGDWSITLSATADVVGPNQGVTCTVVKAPFHNAKGLGFTLARAHVWHRLARRFSARDVRVGDEGFDRRFRLSAHHAQEARRQAVIELFGGEALRRSLPARAFNHLTVLDHEGITGPRYGEGVDLLYYEEPRVLIHERELDGLLLSYAHLLERLEQTTGLVDDVTARLGGGAARLRARAPEALKAVLQQRSAFYAGHVDRQGDEMIARVNVPELEGETGELCVGIPALPSKVAPLTATLPLPAGDLELPLKIGPGAMITWRPTLLDVRAPIAGAAIGDVVREVLAVWHRAVRERLGLVLRPGDDDEVRRP